MKLFKKNYTLAGLMADIVEEKRQADILNIDLQKYLDQIQAQAELGYRETTLFFDNTPTGEVELKEVQKSLNRLGFKTYSKEFGYYSSWGGYANTFKVYW